MNRLRFGPRERTETPLRCLALEPGGVECLQGVGAPGQQRCPQHQQEYRELYQKYKDAEAHYSSLEPPENGFDADWVNEKIAWGKKTIKLRTEVNQRFFNHARKDRGHVRWILKLSEEIRVLEDQVNSATGRDTEQSDGPERRLVFRSLLSPEVPFSDLDHLPADHPVRTLKKCLADITEAFVTRLYEIAPSLNDPISVSENHEENETREPDAGDHVMRFILREYLLWRADEEALSKATMLGNIDRFLRSIPWMLQDLIKFFELLGRRDTLHFLRDAICDYIASCEASGASSSVVILGSPINTDDKQQRMTVQGWDILYQHFRNVVHWTNIELFCVGFEDVVLVQRLIALGRYSNSDEFEWSREGQVSQEDQYAVFYGFVAVSKGFSDPPLPPTVVQDGVTTYQESRCYLVGKMAKNDPLSKLLIQELVNRVARFIVIVLDGESNKEAPTKTISRNDEHDEVPWIKRKMSAKSGESLDSIDWTIEWSLQDIMRDMAVIRDLKESQMRKDYFEFIIIDQDPALDFRILDEVVDALLQINGDPSPKKLLERAVQSSLPREEQSQWLGAIAVDAPFDLDLNLADYRYEGNRVRAWDILDKDPSFLRGLRRRKLSRHSRRIICKLLSEMERNGVVCALKTCEPSYGSPVVLQGIDGHEDIYIAYNLKPTSEDALSRASVTSQQIFGSFRTFLRAAKAKNPTAIFGKGRVHVHYCAWPMAPPKDIPAFRTVEGHLYRWKALPFDYPLSSQIWQLHINKLLNEKLPFAHFCQTTFIVSATDRDNATANLKTLFAVAGEHGWKLSASEPQDWASNIDDLGLSTLWKGIPPVLFKPKP